MAGQIGCLYVLLVSVVVTHTYQIQNTL